MIFLSASIPYQDRHKKYIETADIIAIRDSIRALATVAIPKSKLIWGGHPAITPLIKLVMQKLDPEIEGNKHITLYQSEFFTKDFPVENEYFENIKIIPKKENREKSLLEMRFRMMKDNEFKVGIFIGGMEGVEDEFNLFREFHKEAILLPVASTGAAARIIYDKMINSEEKVDTRLLHNYAYMALFRDLLKDFIQF